MPSPENLAAPGHWSTASTQGTLIPDRFLAALANSDQRVFTQVDVYSGPNLLQTLPNVTAGQVTVDYTATTRRTLTLTVQSNGTDKDNLTPEMATDLLHPASGNELHVMKGFQYDDGSQDLCMLGVFRMSKPVVTDSGSGIEIRITGYDRSAYITRLKWTGPYLIRGGTDLSSAIKALILNRWVPSQPLAFNFCPTNPVPFGARIGGQTLAAPNQTLGTSLTSANDPWADAVKLAAGGGLDLFFDAFGTCTLEPILPPTTATTFDGLYEEGENCTFTTVGRTLDESTTYSGVIAIGNGSVPGVPSVQSQSVINGRSYTGIWNTDPTSPTYYDPSVPHQSRWGPVPYIFETTTIPGYQTVPAFAVVTAGNPTLTGVSTTVGMVVGGPISGDGIPDGTTIQSLFPDQIIMSQPATASASGVPIAGAGPPDNGEQAQAKINGVGWAMLQRVNSVLDAPVLTAAPNPGLGEFDSIAIMRQRIGMRSYNVAGEITPTPYIVQSFVLPLDPSSPMTVTLRPQPQKDS